MLFGETGVGKTSLLNAGVMPILRENDFIPLSIRFNDSYADPMETIYSTIDDMAERTKLDYAVGDRGGLHGFFSTAEFRDPGRSPTDAHIDFRPVRGLFHLPPYTAPSRVREVERHESRCSICAVARVAWFE